VTKSLPLSKCSAGDFACLCSDDTYITSSETCILSGCTVKEALRTFKLGFTALILVALLTITSVAQRWQKKACQAPIRNTGPLTTRVGTALVTIAGASVILRFVARWLIKDSTVGWDDWTILASVILLIPSTILLKISSSLSILRPPIVRADFFSTVAQTAMGQDIWTVPFENINMMFKVCVQVKHSARS